MSQVSFTIVNDTFPNTRTAINAAIQALASNNSGTAAPSTTYAGMFWYDTTNALVKMRDSANSNWITLWALGTTDEIKLSSGKLRVESTNPFIYLKDTDAGTNEKNWRFDASGQNLKLITYSDADAAGSNVINIQRSGTTVSGVEMPQPLLTAVAWYGTTGGTSTAYTVTGTPAPAAYYTGMTIAFKTNASCGANPTINVNGLGAKNLKTKSGGAVGSSDIASDEVVIAWYDGTEFRCIGVGSTSTGRIIQNVVNYIGTRVAVTASIPNDNTIPQITEGGQLISQAFTPISASSTIEVTVMFALNQDGSTGSAAASALFDTGVSSTDAVRGTTSCSNTSGTHTIPHVMTYSVASGSTSARTFSVRVGGLGSSVSYGVNSQGTSQIFGGAGNLMMSIKEIL